MIYFRSVKFYRHDITKKAYSVLLIALMLFINGVKLFHTHAASAQYTSFDKATSSTLSDAAGVIQFKQDDHCIICNFQLVRDAYVSELNIVVSPLQQATLVYAAHLPAFLAAFHILSSGRAPPTQV
jgi:hypothetical protein